MPRRKKTIGEILPVEAINEKIVALEADIEKINADLKAKKSELKALAKDKEAAIKAAAERKVEEEKVAILDAVKSSGKTVEEILDFLKK